MKQWHIVVGTQRKIESKQSCWSRYTDNSRVESHSELSQDKELNLSVNTRHAHCANTICRWYLSELRSDLLSNRCKRAFLSKDQIAFFFELLQYVRAVYSARILLWKHKQNHVLCGGMQIWQCMFVYSVYNQISSSATGWKKTIDPLTFCISNV